MTTPAGWYPAEASRVGEERYWDGTDWTSAYRPAGAKAAAPNPVLATAKWKQLSPVGQLLRLLAIGGVLGGLILGFGIHAKAVGVDGTSVADLENAHQVDCGTAFQKEFDSVLCEQALSGKKTTAIVLLVLGGTLGVAASVVGRREEP